MSAHQYLTFRLGQEIYALDVAHAREVIEVATLTPMPKAPAWLRGVVNLRGSIVPVFDLKRKLEMGETELSRRSSVILLELTFEDEPLVVGVLADAAIEVFDYADEDIEPPPRFGARFSRAYIRGVGRRNGYLFVILETEKVFADTDALVLDDPSPDDMPEMERREDSTNAHR